MQSRFDEAEAALRRAMELAPELCAAARGPGRPAHDAGALRGCRRELPGGAAPRSEDCRSPGRSWARRWPRSAAAPRRTRRSRRGSSRIRTAARSRSRSTTCAPGARTKPSRRCARSLRANPDNVDAMHTLAQAYWGDEKRVVRRRSDAAAGDGARARATPRPGRCSACSCMARSDRRRRSPAYLRGRRNRAGNAAAWSGLGQDYAQVGDMERSRAAYARVARAPARTAGHPHELRACAEVAGPAGGGAARVPERPSRSKPEFGEVYWSMANLKVFRFEPSEVAAMEEQLERDGPERKRRGAFPVRARQGVRGRGRLRPRVGILPVRQRAPAAARLPRPGRVRGQAREDRVRLQRASSSTRMRARASSRMRRSSSSGCRAPVRR